MKPEPQIKTVAEYDFMKVKGWLKGQDAKYGDAIWDLAADYWDLSNDSYLSVSIDEDDFENQRFGDGIKNDAAKLMYENFIKPHEGMEVMFYVSW